MHDSPADLLDDGRSQGRSREAHVQGHGGQACSKGQTRLQDKAQINQHTRVHRGPAGLPAATDKASCMRCTWSQDGAHEFLLHGHLSSELLHAVQWHSGACSMPDA